MFAIKLIYFQSKMKWFKFIEHFISYFSLSGKENAVSTSKNVRLPTTITDLLRYTVKNIAIIPKARKRKVY